MSSKGMYDSIPRTASESDDNDVGESNNTSEAEENLAELLKGSLINETRRLRKSVRWLQLSLALSNLVLILLLGLFAYHFLTSPKRLREDWPVITSTDLNGSFVRKVVMRS
jgi:hypothetical protein